MNVCNYECEYGYIYICMYHEYEVYVVEEKVDIFVFYIRACAYYMYAYLISTNQFRIRCVLNVFL